MMMKSLEYLVTETNDLLCKVETAQQLAMLDSSGKVIAFDYAQMLQEIVSKLRGEVDEMVELMITLKQQHSA